MGEIHIIDDDHLCRETMVEIIMELGFSTKGFSSGDSYLYYMKQENYTPPEAIFSDMNMPGINGLTTLHQVFRCYPDVACYIITGDTAQFSRLNISNGAIREILSKPSCINKINTILQSL